MGRQKTYDRDEVLAKARDCFWKAGYEGAHLSDLIETTGINRFSLYKEFKGKDGLFKEALMLYAREAAEHYDRLLSKEPLGLENIHTYFEAIQIEPDYHGCFIVNTLTEKSVIPQDAFEIARAFTNEAEKKFRANLAAAVQRCELPKNTDVSVLARTLVVLDNGLAVSGIAYPDQKEALAVTKLFLKSVLERE